LSLHACHLPARGWVCWETWPSGEQRQLRPTDIATGNGIQGVGLVGVSRRVPPATIGVSECGRKGGLCTSSPAVAA